MSEVGEIIGHLTSILFTMYLIISKVKEHSYSSFKWAIEATMLMIILIFLFNISFIK